jgi:hypothetical protein
MLSYLFLLAAAATPSELPTTDLAPTETSAFNDAMADQEIQELITVLAQEEACAELVVQEQTATTTELVAIQATPITITNAIEPNMLEYKHWTGKYSPETFIISVNGTKIEQGKTCEVPATATTVEIGYTYSFMNGMKTGGRKISYQLNENITQANITFNWKDDWRVVVDNGTAIKEINV